MKTLINEFPQWAQTCTYAAEQAFGASACRKVLHTSMFRWWKPAMQNLSSIMLNHNYVNSLTYADKKCHTVDTQIFTAKIFHLINFHIWKCMPVKIAIEWKYFMCLILQWKYMNLRYLFSRERIIEDFGYVIRWKILLLLIPIPIISRFDPYVIVKSGARGLYQNCPRATVQ